MPFEGPDWLALTPEPTLEPEMPICDPRHHRLSKGYSASERAALFHDTAARVYRINV